MHTWYLEIVNIYTLVLNNKRLFNILTPLSIPLILSIISFSNSIPPYFYPSSLLIFYHFFPCPCLFRFIHIYQFCFNIGLKKLLSFFFFLAYHWFLNSSVWVQFSSSPNIPLSSSFSKSSHILDICWTSLLCSIFLNLLE